MGVIDRIDGWNEEFTQLRRDIHAHPEIAFEEVRTADIVASALESYGIEVSRGLATTGVVGTLRAGSGNRAIGLRADMDALPMDEENTFAHASRHKGKMHGCGHDGHTAMLLAAARYLAETKEFDGTIKFIFQPAEENEGGARVMVEEGLFNQHPVDAVFGLHNMPMIPVGKFFVRPGAMMAAFDIFDITVKGVGGHAAMPSHGVDPMVAAAHIVSALQTIVSRNVDPLKSAVVSVTKIHAGNAYNVIPDKVEIAGCTRSFSPRVGALIEERIRDTVTHIARGLGAEATVSYERRYPPTVNSAEEAAFVIDVLRETFGAENVVTEFDPAMGSEDFAYMLEAKPGCYIWAGNGTGADGGCMVHNPEYDFNDTLIPYGATYWVRLAERFLARK